MTESPSSLDNLTASDNTPYWRGSKTARVKTARVAKGARLLTVSAAIGSSYPTWVRPAYQKVGSTVRVVERVSWRYVTTGRPRAQRRYEVWFTDGTHAENLTPIETWDALVLDTASSASRQHFIDAGWYLTEAEVAEYA